MLTDADLAAIEARRERALAIGEGDWKAERELCALTDIPALIAALREARVDNAKLRKALQTSAPIAALVMENAEHREKLNRESIK